MNRKTSVGIQIFFSFIVGVVLSALFFWVFIEGLKAQLQNNNFSLALYLLAALSGLAALYNYKQAKKTFTYFRMS